MSKSDETKAIQPTPNSPGFGDGVEPGMQLHFTGAAGSITPLEVLQQSGDFYVPTKPEQIIGQRFAVVNLKYMSSTLGTMTHYWYVEAVIIETQAKIGVALGGELVVRVLDAYALQRNDYTLNATLNWHAGGQYSGYYTLD